MAPIQSISGDALVVCTCGGKEYKARDVIDAALFRGELEKSWKEFLCRIAAEQRARELKLELDYVAVEDMADALRHLFITDLIFSDELDRLTQQLTWRLAALAENGRAQTDSKEITREREEFL